MEEDKKERAVPVIRREKIYDNDDLIGMMEYYCPACGNKFTFITRVKYNYCNICGQKLNWSMYQEEKSDDDNE